MIALLRKRHIAANRILADGEDREVVKDHVEWRAVIEGFELLQNDLLKLQVSHFHLIVIFMTDLII